MSSNNTLSAAALATITCALSTDELKANPGKVASEISFYKPDRPQTGIIYSILVSNKKIFKWILTFILVLATSIAILALLDGRHILLTWAIVIGTLVFIPAGFQEWYEYNSDLARKVSDWELDSKSLIPDNKHQIIQDLIDAAERTYGTYQAKADERQREAEVDGARAKTARGLANNLELLLLSLGD